MAGTLTISTLSDGTNSTSTTNCIQGSAKAWVNFNGTGTVAIRASGNVSSITDSGGSGNYNVNFTTNMPDANYSAVAATSNDSTIRADMYTSSYVRIVTNSATADAATVSVAIFR